MIYALILLIFGVLPIAILWLLRRDLVRRYWGSLLVIVTLIGLVSIPWEIVSVNTIWYYSPKAVWGPALLGIPVEELFFYAIDGLLVGTLALLLEGKSR